MGVKKRLAVWDSWATACGFRPAEPTRNGHFRWLHQDGKTIVTMGSSPSDHHAEANLRALFRRAGRAGNGEVSEVPA